MKPFKTLFNGTTGLGYSRIAEIFNKAGFRTHRTVRWMCKRIEKDLNTEAPRNGCLVD